MKLYILSFVFEKTLKLVPFIEAIFCKYFGYQTKWEYFADFSYSDLERVGPPVGFTKTCMFYFWMSDSNL